MKSQAKIVVSSKPSVVRKTKVFVGLSGGVDSAVSAALLKKEGYEVTGVFIKAWDPFKEVLAPRSSSGVGCTWKEDRRSAMRAAAVLDIPFLTLDLEKEYKKEVVDYMLREYKLGRTPNPDVMCNKEIKFGHFLKFALGNPPAGGGADFVATGHYAQTSPRPRKLNLPLSLARRGERGEVILKEGKDKEKDQSYFLWTLTQDQLKHVMFPIGHLQKEEVRSLAKKFKLPQATRKDSQGLCFLGKIDMKEFLREYIKPRKGDVLNENGEVIGEHDGAVFYTIGERHGFKVTQKTDNESPLYVVAKDIVKNTITVAPRLNTDEKNQTVGQKIVLSDVTWDQGREPDLKKFYTARVRYRGEKIKCQIQIGKDRIAVSLAKYQQGVSLGQSLVLYHGEVCIGGGVMLAII